MDKWKKKCVALSHAVISAVRPRSFVSTLLTGISSYLYRKFGSRHSINILSAVGFAASYNEASLLEVSSILRSQKPTVKEDAFCQFVFDNADFNVNTIDGSGTFHAMVGIMCVTPRHAIHPDESMKRFKKCPSTEIVKQAENTQLQMFHRVDKIGLQNVIIEDLEKQCSVSNEIIPSTTDMIWICGK